MRMAVGTSSKTPRGYSGTPGVQTCHIWRRCREDPHARPHALSAGLVLRVHDKAVQSAASPGDELDNLVFGSWMSALRFRGIDCLGTCMAEALFRARPSLAQYAHARFFTEPVLGPIISYRLTCMNNASPFLDCCDAQISSFRNRNGKRRHQELSRNWPWS